MSTRAGTDTTTRERKPTPAANPNAVRDHLANERTLLAWVRTSIAIVGLGFVVSRFGLVTREIGIAQPRHLPLGTSTAFGTALVVCGAVLLALAARQYLRAGREIERNVYRWTPALALTLCGGVVVVAVLLAVYLLLTA